MSDLIVDESVSGTVMTAEFAKSLSDDPDTDFRGDVALFRVTPNIKYRDELGRLAFTDYVVVSAAVVPFSGPETYIFPGNVDGEILDWFELDGSYKGGLDHREALERAGYEVSGV